MGRRTAYEHGWFDCYRLMRGIMQQALKDMTKVRREWSQQNERDRAVAKTRAAK